MLNPIHALDHVTAAYRDYLTTEFRARDPELRQRLEEALEREGFLAQEPFFSAHQPFQPGVDWAELPLDPQLAAALRARAGGNPTYRHQQAAIEYLLGPEAGPLVVSTGTGSGKTEAFLAPVLQAALSDAVATHNRPGLVALLLYPMNALANDQEARIQKYLAESGWDGTVRVAMYNRNTTQQQREELRQQPPHLLLTNYQMLEYLLVRPADREALFSGHRLRFVVLDEVHTYSGTLGSHVALLLRRLRAQLQAAAPDQPAPLLVGTSATIAKPGVGAELAASGPAAVQQFFGKLVGVPPESVRVLSEAKLEVVVPPDARYAGAPYVPPDPDLDDPATLRRVVTGLADLPPETPVLEAARRCKLLWDLNLWLGQAPRALSELVRLVKATVPERAVWDEATLGREVALGLRVGAALAALGGAGDTIPGALRLRAHRFVRGGWEFHRCLNPECGALYARGEPVCQRCGAPTAPLYLCRQCGADFWRLRGPADGRGKLTPHREPERLPEGEAEWLLYLPRAGTADYEEDEADGETLRVGEDGSVYEFAVETLEELAPRGKGKKPAGRKLEPIPGIWLAQTQQFVPQVAGQQPAFIYPSRKRCPNCGSTGGSHAVITRVSLGTSAALKVLTESVLETLPSRENEKKRVLIFADSRQDAAHQARFIDFAAHYDRMRGRVTHRLQAEGPLPLARVVEQLGALALEQHDNPHLSAPGPFGHQIPKGEERDAYFAWEEAPLLDDLAVNTAYRATLENLGLLAVEYEGVEALVAARQADWAGGLGVRPEQVGYVVQQLLDGLRKVGALSRPLLQHHPDGPVRQTLVRGAAWERRFKNPIGLPVAADGRPTLRLAGELPKGVAVKALWGGGKGRAPKVQQLLTQLAARLNDGAPTEMGVLAVLTDLAQAQYLIRAKLYGTQGKPVELYQVNAALVLLAPAAEDTRRRCDACGKVVHLPRWVQAAGTLPCPRCQAGRLCPFPEKTVRSSRYARRALDPEAVPLNAAEHTAQIPGERRRQLEDNFKAATEPVNVLACSPTLELGIHVGGLEAVLLRNVPPRPDNYAQRGGRAGRDERVGLVVGYTRNTPHDQYFFQHPAEMIAGAVPAPAFSLGNRDAVTRHLYAIAFGLVEPGIASRMTEYVTFDGQVRQEQVVELLTGLQATQAAALALALKALSGEVLAAAGYTADDLRTWLAALPDRVQQAFDRTAQQVARLHEAVKVWSQIGGAPWSSQRAGTIINHLLGIPTGHERADEAPDLGSAYPLRRLAEFGLLPGYEFPVEPATLRLLGDADEWATLQTGRLAGLRQYQPGALVYARGRRWKVIGLDLSSPWNPQGDEPTWHYQRCSHCGLAFNPQEAPVCPRCGQASVGLPLPAMAYAGFLARPDESALSEEEERTYGRDLVETHPSWLPTGQQPVAGRWRLPAGWRLEWRQGERVSWLNAGPEEQGYALCPECGKLLTPVASLPAKAGKGRKAPGSSAEGGDVYGHAKNCARQGQPVTPVALYTEATVETLRLLFPWPGNPDVPEERQALQTFAVTLGYALLAGAERYFALAPDDLEVLWEGLRPQAYQGQPFQQGVLTFLDPNLGGSGYLPKMAEEWAAVAAAALHHLEHDDCETACYRCLKSYTNQRYHDRLAWPLVTATLEELQATPAERLPLTAADVDDPRPWLEAYAAGCGSPLELRCRQLLTAAGLAPEQQYAIADEHGRAFTVADFAFPAQRVAIYVDGAAFHKGARLRRDRAIDARLQALGWRVLRCGAAALGPAWVAEIKQRLEE